MANIFEGPKRMLRRRKHHIADSATQINSFVQDKPWSRLHDVDVDGITELHKIKFTETLSEESLISFSMLPIICVSLSIRPLSKLPSGTPVRLLLSTPNFPLGQLKLSCSTIWPAVADLPSEIQTLFRGFEPYKGMNNTVWALNEPCNSPKHKALIPVQLSGGTITISDGGL